MFLKCHNASQGPHTVIYRFIFHSIGLNQLRSAFILSILFLSLSKIQKNIVDKNLFLLSLKSLFARIYSEICSSSIWCGYMMATARIFTKDLCDFIAHISLTSRIISIAYSAKAQCRCNCLFYISDTLSLQ